MIQPDKSDDGSRLRSLQAEVLAKRRQMEQRDEMLRVLNRRLLKLERGEADTAAMVQIETERLNEETERLQKETERLQEENRDLRREVEMARVREENRHFRHRLRSVLDTEMFRWATPARRLHGKLHGRRQGSA